MHFARNWKGGREREREKARGGFFDSSLPRRCDATQPSVGVRRYLGVLVLVQSCSLVDLGDDHTRAEILYNKHC